MPEKNEITTEIIFCTKTPNNPTQCTICRETTELKEAKKK